MHAASAVRNGRAFLFAGVSGAGKTTISRLAPPDATLLTDEISYVRREADGYVAFGTPFAGELAQPGDNMRAPLGRPLSACARPRKPHRARLRGGCYPRLLESMLFFAHDAELVGRVFDSVFDFVQQVRSSV